MPACFNTQDEQSGFTLVELLVVVAIIGVLATIGVTVFTGARSSANNAKAKADIDSIRKAYEGKYDPISGNYAPLTDSDFSGGKIPTPDAGGSYFVAGPNFSPSPTTANFALCASIKTGATCPSATPGDCTCNTSTQGTPVDPSVISGICNATLSNGLIGYWDFNENTGSTVADKKGSGNGTWNGTLGSQWATGKVGSSGNFNGSNNYVDALNYSALTGLSTITVAGWINTPTGSSGRIINVGTNYILFLVLSGGELQVLINNNSGGAHTTSPVITPNLWHHVAFTWTTAGTISIYVNGALKPVTGAPTNTSIIGAGGNLRFGAYTNGGTVENFTGRIDDVRIYNRVLSDPEISNLYNIGYGCAS